MKPFTCLPTLRVFLSVFFVLIFSSANAVIFYSKGNLPANVRTNWSTTTDGSGVAPTTTQFTAAGHTFVVQNGDIMTTTAVWTIASNLQIDAGGSLTTGNTSTYTLTIGGTTVVSGTLVLASTAVKTFTGNATVNSGGIFTVSGNGTVVFSANLTVSSGGTFNHNNSYDNANVYVQVNGDLAIAGTYSYGSNTPAIWMNGTGTRYISTGTSALCKLLLRQANYYANGTVTVNQDFFAMWNQVGGSFHTNNQTVNAVWGIVNNGGTFYVDGGVLTVGSSIGGMLIGRTLTQNGDLQVSAGTVNTPGIYLGTTTATPKGSCTQSGGIINTGILDLGNACTFVQSAGTNNVNGPLNLNYATSAYSHTTGATTINIAGNFLNNGVYSTGAGIAAINLSGNWTNNLTFTTSATNTVTFNGTSAQSLGGTAATIFNHLVINPSAGIAVTAAQNSTVIGNLSVTSGIFDLASYTCNRTLTGGTFSLAAGTTLKLAGGSGGAGSSNFPNNFTATTLDATSLTEYNGTGAQTIYATPAYGHLTLSTGNTKTAGNNLSIAGNLNINTTATFAGSSYSHTIAGNWYNNVSATAFTGGTSTVTLNGIAAQTIGGTAGTTFNRLTINNSAGAIIVQDQTVSSVLTLTAGLLDIGSNNLTMGASASAVAGTPFSATKMIIADGGGEMRKNMSASGSYLFPVGDESVIKEYSPITLNYTAGTYAGGAYTGVKVNNAKYSANASSTDFLRRYWTVSNSGITAPSFTATATYTATDIAGTEGNIAAAKYTALPWIKYGVIGSNTLATTAITNTGAGIIISGITTAVPAVAISGGGVNVCPGTGVSLGSTITNNGTASVSYAWSPATGLSASTIANPVATVSATTTYTLTATDGNGITGDNTTTITINPTPAVPTVSVTAQPTCSVATGTITITAPTGVGFTYSTNGSTYTNTTGVFSAMAAGTYSITAKNGSGCISSAASVTVNAQPATPATPTVSVTAQPTCSVATGTITITAPTGAGMTYSTNGSTYTNTTGVFSGMASGTYSITAKNSSGCTSAAASVTVNAQPATPATPTASVTAQPTCTVATGTITITAPTGAGITYSTNGSTYTNTTGVFTGMGSGTYNITARNSSGCTSSAASVTVNAQPATPPTPTVSVTAQLTCAVGTGTITVTAPLGAGITYSTNGSTYTNTTGVFSGITPGTFNITARNSSGCTSSAASVTVNPTPAVPATPTVNIIAQPTCVLATGTIAVTAPTGIGMTYSIDGVTYTNLLGIFSGMTSGTYQVTAKDLAGCISAPASVALNAPPLRPTGLLSGTTALCSGGSTTISIDVSGAGIISGTLSDGTPFSGNAPVITVPVSPTASTTYTISTLSNGACAAVSSDMAGSLLVNVTSAVSAVISYASTPFCWNSGSALANITGTPGGVYSISPAGATINASTGAINLATSAPGVYTVSYTLGSIGACGIFTATAPVSINPNTWTGQYSSDWNLPGNWAGNAVPTPFCPDITILGTAPFKPEVNSGSFAVENLYIKPGATLVIDNATIRISGTINNAGTFDVSNGTVRLNGNAAQTIPVNAFLNNAVKNLVISNTSSGGVTLGGRLDIFGALTFTGTGKKLNTNDSLTLKSTDSGTARVGDMTGNNILGKVTVERFFSKKRAWRLLSVPTNSSRTIRDAWQEGADTTTANPVSGYGIQITTNASTWDSTGFDLQSPNGPSLKKWNADSSRWEDIGSTLIPFPDPKAAYFTFVRGDRTASVLSSPPTITTLRTKGNLYTGNQTAIVVKPNQWVSIGNPYASAIDMRSISKTGVKDFFYVWDPKLSGTLGLGAWQTFSRVGGNYLVTPGGGSYGVAGSVSNFIESGQGFFVEGTVVGGTVSFSESNKSNGSVLAFRPVAGANATLRVNLFGTDADNSEYAADGVLIDYDKNYNNAIDEMDAYKSGNTGENLGIKNNGKILVVERRKSIVQEDTIWLNIKGMKKQQYRFEIEANLQRPGMTGFIEDNYLQTKTALNLEGTTSVLFKTDNVAASSANNRFRIVFAEIPGLPFSFTDIKARKEITGAKLTWKVANEKNIDHYEVEKSADSISYVTAHTIVSGQDTTNTYHWTDLHVIGGVNYYRIKSIAVDGTTQHSESVSIQTAPIKQQLSIYPNPIKDGKIRLQLADQPAGIYIVKVAGSGGEMIITKSFAHTGGAGTQVISLPAIAPHGIYLVEIITPSSGIIRTKAVY